MKKYKNTKIILTLGIAIIFLLPCSILTTVSYEQKKELTSNEIISYNYINTNQLDISFKLQDLSDNKVTSKFGEFKIFEIPNFGFIGQLGKPQLPVVTSFFAVPTLEVSLNIDNSHIAKSYYVGKLYPAQKPQSDSENANNAFIIDETFYKQDLEYPGKLVEIVQNGKIRDISFVKIEFYPIQYNPKKGIATIYDEITIQISWNDGQTVAVESGFNDAIFSDFYKNVFPNWQGYLKHTQIIESSQELGDRFNEDGCDYLIITHPDFYSEIVELANWKHLKGLITKVVDTDSTGTSSGSIKQYIQDAYDSWDPRPSYILLVGDSEFIPTSSSGTDLYYATVDGSDYFPDIFHGRIPVDTNQEANIIVDKILSYEQTPPLLSSFYENFVVAAYFQDDENNGYETRRFVRTSEEIRDYLLEEEYEGERIYVTESYINPTHYNDGYYGNGEPLPDELLRPTFPWDGKADDIVNAIENGVFILNHRDHGFEDGWGDPYFDTAPIDGLTNGELLPVVFSINCLTGKFDNYECFCEKFIRKEDGGCVAIFGATRVSYSGYNDFLCRGFYDAQWPDFDNEVGTDIPMYTLGELLNYGKVYMTQTWGDPWDLEQTTFELFHCFGDPTMEIWSAFPKDLDVTYIFSGDYIEIKVDGNTGPIEGALVCLSQESGFYAKGVTGSTGTVNLDTTSAIYEEEVTIVVSFHNHLSYQETFFLNRVPEIPDKPDGPTTGKPREELTFSTITTDFDEDQVYYMWRWGDGHYSNWLGPYNSGETAEASHSWSEPANYNVRVKAKDITGQETDWSEALSLRITKTMEINSLFLRFFESHLDLFQTIKYLLILLNKS